MESRKVIVTVELETSETTPSLKSVINECLECNLTKVVQIQFNVIRDKKKGKK